MPFCTRCGRENPEVARFCLACGAALAEAPPARERRKTVTVLFCDVTDSTRLGERLDAESFRRVMARYFEVMQAVVQRHGGTVEKFIGDAVMAVFGVPLVHEDDGLRAVRAAAEMREALAGLNEELGREYGETLELRIGVNTGEVVSGTHERLVTGDPVTVAARLEQAAAPGEILLGEQTLRLVRFAVEVEPVEPLRLKGKSEAISAHRLLSVAGEVAAPRAGARMVGRERQLGLLADAYETAVRERSCRLVTVLGVAGVGKSRLAAEFVSGIEGRVVRGRCLSYGEGITYSPVVEILGQLPPPGDLGLDELAAAALAGLLGEGEQPSSPEEAAWAFRTLLEACAPVVAVFDDVHWAEPTLLDLVEHVAGLSRDAPILLLCLARPELLDRRPGWPGGELDATTILLEPLAADETDRLVGELSAGRPLPPALRARIGEAAGGNPLFVEEMVALVAERGGDGEVEIPPSIQALLAARLDQLDAAERAVLECAAVEGKVFHRGAVQVLAPEAKDVPARLSALVRKELIRPDRAQLPGEKAFRFRHVLIRDAAYEGLPKSIRAELHERFADWLEQHGVGLVELDELLGYHLEQAVRYRSELRRRDERAAALAVRARERLASAGRRALDRGDVRAASALLGRALALAARDSDDVALRLDLAEAGRRAGDTIRAREVAASAASVAAAAGDRRGELLARLKELRLARWGGAQASGMLALAREEALPFFEGLGDDAALAEGWLAVAFAEQSREHHADSLDASGRALKHARLAGLVLAEREAEWTSGVSLFRGPNSVAEALRWCDDHRHLEASRPHLTAMRGVCLARLGLFAEARAAIREAEERMEQLGQESAFVEAWFRSEIEKLAGNMAAVERHARRGCEMLERMGGREGHLSTSVCWLAEALCALGRDAEAEQWTKRGEELGASDDVLTEVLWRRVRAGVLAKRGEWEEAERLAREAVARAEQTDQPIFRGEALAALADVLAVAGRTEEASAMLERALAEYEQKGVLPLVQRTRARLAELSEAAPV